MNRSILFALFINSTVVLNAQSVAINTDGSTAAASALLDIKSADKGLLIPRLTKAQKNAIPSPANGLLIYQSGPDSIGFYYYQGGGWNWLTDNKKNESSYWNLHGNINTTPPSSSNNASINYGTDTYIGTYQSEDVSLVAGGNELVRLKQLPFGGRIGLSNRNPEYALDIRLTDINPPTSVEGLRIIPNGIFDINNPVNTDKGIVFGTTNGNPQETLIWNYGNNIGAAIRIGFDQHTGLTRPALNLTQYGQGIYQRNPKYMLDIHSVSQFSGFVPSHNKNGTRVTYPFQEYDDDLFKGLFMGVGLENAYKSYIWNYADGFTGNSSARAIYFGVGSDMHLGGNKATMELQDGKIIMGHITDPDFNFPSTLNIQSDYTSAVARKGLSIIKAFTNEEVGYFGADNGDHLNIYKYGGGNIFLGSPFGDAPVTINSNNQLGIKTFTPNADLQFDDNFGNNKLVLHNNFHGNIPFNFHDFYGFGVNSGILRYQIPRNFTAHAFYAGNLEGTTSNELMRINGNGFVGIGTSTPHAPLEFASSQGNRKIVLAGFGLDNDDSFFGFGRNNGELRYQVSTTSDDHVFYTGAASGFGSTELFRIRGNGNVGVGTDFPIAYGHTGTNKIFEIKNSATGSNIQSQLILSSGGNTGSLGGITWASLPLAGEERTAFIGNTFENANQTKLSFFTRSNTGVLAERFYIQGDGNAWLQGTLTQASDARLKTNINQIKDPIEKINQLSGYTYNWRDKQSEQQTQMGLLAQEVQKVYPHLVKENDKGELSVNYIALIPLLLEGMKEQQKQIDELRMMMKDLIQSKK